MSTYKKPTNNYFVESGLKEIKLLRKYFHVEGTGDNVQVKKEVTPTDITSFYKEYFTRVRPQKLGLEKILPPPDLTKLRALYMGESDVNVLLNMIVRHTLYVDQILIVDPFLTVILGDHPKSVLNQPESWVSVLVNRALCLCALEEWIKQGIILLFPNIFYYHPELLQIPSSLRVAPEHRQAFERNFVREFLLNERLENRNAALDVLVKMGKKISDSERSGLLEEVGQYERENPVRFRLASGYYDKHFPESHTRGEVLSISNGGIPLIHASQLSEQTGSFLIFEHQYVYETLCGNFDARDETTNSLQQLSLAFQKLDFLFLHNVSSKKALDLRNQGYLLSFRNYLRELWQLVTPATAIENQQTLNAKIANFYDRLTSEYQKLEKEWESIRGDLRTNAAVTGVVTGLTVIAPGSITFAIATAVIAGLGHSGYQSIKDLRQTNQKPLAVFLKLAH